MTTEPDARFARQLAIPDLGREALARLRKARVHVVGAGPTGGPALVLLAQAGVGTIFLDDAGDVRPSDHGSWLYDPADAGVQRPLAALAPLRAAGAGISLRLWASEARPTATLVCAESESAARDASERARRAGLPHVVGLAARDAGEVVVVPSGEPCFRCASPPAARVPPSPADAAALGALAATELVLLVARSGRQAGRRIDLVQGWPTLSETRRRPECDCRVAY